MLAWNSRLDCIQCTPNLITKNEPIDFDLVIVDATTNEPLWWSETAGSWSTTPGVGRPVSSFSFNNSYEVIELSEKQTQALPGTARVELRLFGQVPSTFSERLGYVAYAIPPLSVLEP